MYMFIYIPPLKALDTPAAEADRRAAYCRRRDRLRRSLAAGLAVGQNGTRDPDTGDAEAGPRDIVALGTAEALAGVVVGALAVVARPAGYLEGQGWGGAYGGGGGSDWVGGGGGDGRGEPRDNWEEETGKELHCWRIVMIDFSFLNFFFVLL